MISVMKTDNDNDVQGRSMQGCKPSGTSGVWHGEAGLLLQALIESLRVPPSLYGSFMIQAPSVHEDGPGRMLSP